MTTAILVAAGRGTRMGPGVDKLFLELAGAPVVLHTWRRWDSAPGVDQLVLVVRPGMEEAFRELAAAESFSKPWRLAPGGAERQDSVWAGLQATDPDSELVAVHDAARPCVEHELIRRCLVAAAADGAAVAAQRAVDTVKESDGGSLVARHLDRSRLWAVQTPQCFRREVLMAALEAARAAGCSLTDDTAACSLIGRPVRLVESAGPNPKVTSPSDLPWIEHLLRSGKGGS